MKQTLDSSPLYATGGPIGIVMGHGFAGSPLSVRPWAEHLAAAGHTVSLPLLPGHGTQWPDLETTLWTDWYDTLEQEFLKLRDQCDQVFGFGFSMGGGLVLRLAEQYPDDFAGLVLVNPSIASRRLKMRLLSVFPGVARIVRTSAGIGGDIKGSSGIQTGYDRIPVKAAYQLTQMWRTVRSDLNRITAPILIYRSQIDHVVDSRSSELIQAGVINAPVEERILKNSFHVATLDNDAESIFTGSVAWIKSISTTNEG